MYREASSGQGQLTLVPPQQLWRTVSCMDCGGQWPDGFLYSNKITALFMREGNSFQLAKDPKHNVHDLEQLVESV